ncbi:hypothetical protein [Priestia megaterium]
MEVNLVDDGVPIAYNPQHVDLTEATYVVFDVETTVCQPYTIPLLNLLP